MTFTSAQSSPTTTMIQRPERRRQTGVVATSARVAAGLWLAGSVVVGQWTGTFRPASWLLGLGGFPVAVLAWQWWRARRDPSRFEATGPVAHLLDIVVFLALYLTPWYAPALSVTSDAALLFYGGSMLLAALRGYAGCEVLAVSNWVLGREDQVGCLVFAPVDYLEQRLGRVHHEQIPGGGDVDRDGMPGLEMVAAGDTAHAPALTAMKGRWRRPISGMGWYRDVKTALRRTP